MGSCKLDEGNVHLVLSEPPGDASSRANQSAAGRQVGEICSLQIHLQFCYVRHIPLPHLPRGLSQERWITRTGFHVDILSLSFIT